MCGVWGRMSDGYKKGVSTADAAPGFCYCSSIFLSPFSLSETPWLLVIFSSWAVTRAKQCNTIIWHSRRKKEAAAYGVPFKVAHIFLWSNQWYFWQAWSQYCTDLPRNRKSYFSWCLFNGGSLVLLLQLAHFFSALLLPQVLQFSQSLNPCCPLNAWLMHSAAVIPSPYFALVEKPVTRI